MTFKVPEKLCLFCKNWSFYAGSPGYSEMTPGDEARMNCRKGHYGMGFDMMELSYESGFRTQMLKAVTCQDYDEVTELDMPK